MAHRYSDASSRRATPARVRCHPRRWSGVPRLSLYKPRLCPPDEPALSAASTGCAYQSLRFAKGRSPPPDASISCWIPIPLLRQEILHRPAQAGMGDPMRGVGRPRQIAALDLVPPLRAGLDALQPVRDREIDGAVIAEFEMQERPVAAAAPVAAVQRLGARQVQRAGHRLAGVLRHHQHHPVAQPLPQQRKERPGQIGAAPFAVDRRVVEAIERVPVRLGDVGAGQRVERQAGGVGVAPLAPQHLALARRQRAEEIVEARVARVLPMELHADALQPAGLAQLLSIRPPYRT